MTAINCSEARRITYAKIKEGQDKKMRTRALKHVAHCRKCIDNSNTNYTMQQNMRQVVPEMSIDKGRPHDPDFLKN